MQGSEQIATDNRPDKIPRSWDVLLIGGASGTGKSSVSYALARFFDVGITEVDDFQIILERMTSPEHQPVLHFWRTHPNPSTLTVERILEHQISVAEVMMPAIKAVIASHLESGTPIVLEGDYVLPTLSELTHFNEAPATGRVCAVFLHEPDEDQLLRNYLQREPEAGEQRKRSKVSWLYGNWLKEEAERRNISVLSARPWETLMQRILDVI